MVWYSHFFKNFPQFTVIHTAKGFGIVNEAEVLLEFHCFIYDPTDVEIKALKRDKGHYIMIKGSIQEEDITIINIYAPNIGAPQYVRQMLTR